MSLDPTRKGSVLTTERGHRPRGGLAPDLREVANIDDNKCDRVQKSVIVLTEETETRSRYHKKIHTVSSRSRLAFMTCSCVLANSRSL